MLRGTMLQTGWKKSNNGKFKWKQHLSHNLALNKTESRHAHVTLIVYQYGENNPVGSIDLPLYRPLKMLDQKSMCPEARYCIGRKIPFKLTLKNTVGCVGKIKGYFYIYRENLVYGSQSRGAGIGSEKCDTSRSYSRRGSVDKSISNNPASQYSRSGSSVSSESKDDSVALSLELDIEAPTKFYKLETLQHLYRLKLRSEK
eukprot:UN29856